MRLGASTSPARPEEGVQKALIPAIVAIGAPSFCIQLLKQVLRRSQHHHATVEIFALGKHGAASPIVAACVAEIADRGKLRAREAEELVDITQDERVRVASARMAREFGVTRSNLEDAEAWGIVADELARVLLRLGDPQAAALQPPRNPALQRLGTLTMIGSTRWQ